MPEYLAPGVYIEETSYRTKSIEGVSTSTAGFIGPTAFGPSRGEPELLTSYADFERVYGGLDGLSFDGIETTNYVAHAARAFFEEGGKRLYLVRVANGGTAATTNVADNDNGNTITLAARYPGRIANGTAVTFTFRLGQNLLGTTKSDPADFSSADVNILRGVSEYDLVLLTGGGAASPAPDSEELDALVATATEAAAAVDAAQQAVEAAQAVVDGANPPPDADANLTQAQDDLAAARTARTAADQALVDAFPEPTQPAAKDAAENATAAAAALDTARAEAEAANAAMTTAAATLAAAQDAVDALDGTEPEAETAAANDALASALAAMEVPCRDKEAADAALEAAAEAAALAAAVSAAATATEAMEALGAAESAASEAAETVVEAEAGVAAAQAVVDALDGSETPEDAQVANDALASAQSALTEAEGLGEAASQAVADAVAAAAAAIVNASAAAAAAPAGEALPRIHWLEAYDDDIDQRRSYRLVPANSTGDDDKVPVRDLDTSTQTVRAITAGVAVAGLGSFGQGQAWEALSFHPGHRNALTRIFATAAGRASRATRLYVPVTVTTDIADGAVIAETLLAQTNPVLPDGQTLLNALDDDESSDAMRSLTVSLQGGDDGSAPGIAAYEGSEGTEKTGFKVFEDIEDISIVAAPGSSAGYRDSTRMPVSDGIMRLLISHCERMRYRVAVLDSGDGQLVSQVRAMRSTFDSAHAALYYPWIRIQDPLTRGPLNLPPSGFVAGIYARNDVDHGVHKAPANEVVRLATGYELVLNKAQQDVLNPDGINCFRFFEGRGFRLWGARTISSDSEWKYVNVRRYFAYLERSIEKGTQWVVFENNDHRLWARVRRTIEDFLFNEWKNARLMGTKPEEAYFVQCDRSTMTQNDIDNGRLVCKIGVAPVKPAEFVIFRIGQWTADSQV